MRPRRDPDSPGQALIIPLTLYLRRRRREDGPFPPSPTPAAARRPPAPVCVEAISAQAGAASRLDAA
jgi:hypothetical protein